MRASLLSGRRCRLELYLYRAPHSVEKAFINVELNHSKTNFNLICTVSKIKLDMRNGLETAWQPIKGIVMLTLFDQSIINFSCSFELHDG